MLVSHCPRCGAPLPVSLATPHAITCGACGFEGKPPPDVVARLEAANEVLGREVERDRQLTDIQRRAVQVGSKGEGAVLAVSLVLTAPFLLMIASSVVRGLGMGGAEGRRLLVGGCAYIPTVVVLSVLAWFAFRSVRAMRRELEARCAAVPPLAPGQPARCRVCGGPVSPQGVERVARCPYCRADNLLDPSVLSEQAKARAAHVTDYAAGITASARELQAAGRSRALWWVAAVPLCTCLCGCPNIFFAYQIGLAESSTATCEHVLVSTTAGRCVAERRGELLTIDGQPVVGTTERIRGSRGLPRVRLRGSQRAGRVTGSLSGARVCGGSVNVRWDDDTRGRVGAAQLCWE